MSKYINADALKEELLRASIWTTLAIKEIIDNTSTVKTKEIKYFDEDEKVWKIGSVIVDE